jgi:hypothetical protein
MACGYCKHISIEEDCLQTTQCYNPEDCFLHSHRRENLKSYMYSSCSPLSEPQIQSQQSWWSTVAYVSSDDQRPENKHTNLRHCGSEHFNLKPEKKVLFEENETV